MNSCILLIIFTRKFERRNVKSINTDSHNIIFPSRNQIIFLYGIPRLSYKTSNAINFAIEQLRKIGVKIIHICPMHTSCEDVVKKFREKAPELKVLHLKGVAKQLCANKEHRDRVYKRLKKRHRSIPLKIVCHVINCKNLKECLQKFDPSNFDVIVTVPEFLDDLNSEGKILILDEIDQLITRELNHCLKSIIIERQKKNRREMTPYKRITLIENELEKISGLISVNDDIRNNERRRNLFLNLQAWAREVLTAFEILFEGAIIDGETIEEFFNHLKGTSTILFGNFDNQHFYKEIYKYLYHYMRTGLWVLYVYDCIKNCNRLTINDFLRERYSPGQFLFINKELIFFQEENIREKLFPPHAYIIVISATETPENIQALSQREIITQNLTPQNFNAQIKVFNLPNRKINSRTSLEEIFQDLKELLIQCLTIFPNRRKFQINWKTKSAVHEILKDENEFIEFFNNQLRCNIITPENIGCFGYSLNDSRSSNIFLNWARSDQSSGIDIEADFVINIGLPLPNLTHARYTARKLQDLGVAYSPEYQAVQALVQQQARPFKREKELIIINMGFNPRRLLDYFDHFDILINSSYDCETLSDLFEQLLYLDSKYYARKLLRSGMSVKEVKEMTKIARSTLYHWKNKIEEGLSNVEN